MSFFVMPPAQYFYMEPTQFTLEIFIEYVRSILQIISKVLGREDTHVIDQTILGMFTLMLQPETIFDIPDYWEKNG